MVHTLKCMITIVSLCSGEAGLYLDLFAYFFFLLGRHFPDHVVQNAAVVEVSELHISVKSHDGMKGFPGAQLLGSKKVIQAAEPCMCYLTS